MATTEYVSLLSQFDENGNRKLIYPVTSAEAVDGLEEFVRENTSSGGVDLETDSTLKLENGILSVNTTNQMEQDNTLPITSAGVFATVGNIEALLKTI